MAHKRDAKKGRGEDLTKTEELGVLVHFYKTTAQERELAAAESARMASCNARGYHRVDQEAGIMKCYDCDLMFSRQSVHYQVVPRQNPGPSGT